MRLVFMGTPHFSVPTLNGLKTSGHDIVAVYTQPPRQAGRGLMPQKSPVHLAAEQYGLTVFTPVSLREPLQQDRFKNLKADIAIVVAYGLILPREILQAPSRGCLNLHASLLPRWRGAAPINRAIMAGDKKTGVMVMQMEQGLDTGPILLHEEVEINACDTASTLHDTLMQMGSHLIREALAALETTSLTARPQAHEDATYAHKIDKQETRIDWTQNAERVHNHIRGLSNVPGAWCSIAIDGRMHRLKVLNAVPASGTGRPGEVLDNALTIACGSGAVKLLRVQRSGKAVMNAADFLVGNRLQAGMMLNTS